MTVMTKLRRDILRQLSAGDMSSRDLGAICERSTTATAQALLRLADLGLVRSVGFAPSRERGCKPRIYSITSNGRAVLDKCPEIERALARVEVA